MSGINYKYYSSTFTSDTTVTGSAGEEVKFFIVSRPTSGVTGVRWGSGIESYIEIPYDNVTSIANEKKLTINDYSIKQNYPNPFNSYTSIEYQIPKTNPLYASRQCQVQSLLHLESSNNGVFASSFTIRTYLVLRL